MKACWNPTQGQNAGRIGNRASRRFSGQPRHLRRCGPPRSRIRWRLDHISRPISAYHYDRSERGFDMLIGCLRRRSRRLLKRIEACCVAALSAWPCPAGYQAVPVVKLWKNGRAGSRCSKNARELRDAARCWVEQDRPGRHALSHLLDAQERCALGFSISTMVLEQSQG